MDIGQDLRIEDTILFSRTRRAYAYTPAEQANKRTQEQQECEPFKSHADESANQLIQIEVSVGMTDKKIAEVKRGRLGAEVDGIKEKNRRHNL